MAEPLFFLDYLPHKLDASTASKVVKGSQTVADRPVRPYRRETAEMPGLYKTGEYDLAGFAVGVVDRKKIIDGKRIKAGDVIIGLASSGLHSNGYSLARKVIFETLGLSIGSKPAGLKKDVGSMLLAPTRIYVKPVRKLMTEFEIVGMAHITGGGFTENIPRVIPKGLKAVIKKGTWKMPPVFGLIQDGGSIHEDEMYRTFNCGIGFIIVVRAKDAEKAIARIKKLGERPYLIGTVAKSKKDAPPFVEYI